MDKRKAIPTEYKGVRFDSKSEAVFARLLDLCEVKWAKQHPITHEGHDWDFLIWKKQIDVFVADSQQCFDWIELKPVLVELKPALPSQTYLARLTKNAGLQGEDRIVVFGNPWNKEPYKFLEYSSNTGQWSIPHSICLLGMGREFHPLNDQQVVEHAISYRYDLAFSQEQATRPVQRVISRKESVRLISESREPHRIERLQKVVDFIRELSPGTLGFIESLEDHEGNLTCSWNVKSHRPGLGKTTVENAWESVGELACNVEHLYVE